MNWAIEDPGPEAWSKRLAACARSPVAAVGALIEGYSCLDARLKSASDAPTFMGRVDSLARRMVPTIIRAHQLRNDVCHLATLPDRRSLYAALSELARCYAEISWWSDFDDGARNWLVGIQLDAGGSLGSLVEDPFVARAEPTTVVRALELDDEYEAIGAFALSSGLLTLAFAARDGVTESSDRYDPQSEAHRSIISPKGDAEEPMLAFSKLALLGQVRYADANGWLDDRTCDAAALSAAVKLRNRMFHEGLEAAAFVDDIRTSAGVFLAAARHLDATAEAIVDQRIREMLEEVVRVRAQAEAAWIREAPARLAAAAKSFAESLKHAEREHRARVEAMRAEWLESDREHVVGKAPSRGQRVFGAAVSIVFLFAWLVVVVLAGLVVVEVLSIASCIRNAGGVFQALDHPQPMAPRTFDHGMGVAFACGVAWVLWAIAADETQQMRALIRRADDKASYRTYLLEQVADEIYGPLREARDRLCDDAMRARCDAVIGQLPRLPAVDADGAAHAHRAALRRGAIALALVGCVSASAVFHEEVSGVWRHIERIVSP